jgi:predicted  nucleic acid-binding Zn-ribbon protein
VLALTDAIDTIQTNQQIPVSTLTDLRKELTIQGDAARRFDSHITTIQSELASVHVQVSELHGAQQKLLDQATGSQDELDNKYTRTQTQLQSIEKSLQELRSGGQHLTSELAKLSQELNSQREADAQSNEDRKALVDELANIRSKTVIADETIKTEQADRKKLDSELVNLQQQVAAQTESFTKSASEIAAMRTELASISDQVKTLREVQQYTLDQTAQAQEILKQELSSVREELAKATRSLQPASGDTEDRVSDMVKKMDQELEKHRQLVSQFDTDRRNLVSELSELRNKLGALDEAEQVAQVSRGKLSAEPNALREDIANTTNANVKPSEKSAGAGFGIATRQTTKLDERHSASPIPDEHPEQVADVQSGDQQEPATGPHPPRARIQPEQSAWKITPLPEGSDGQLTHRASGTITRMTPNVVTSPDQPGSPKSASEAPEIIGAIDLPADSLERTDGSQIASVANVSTITNVNTLSDFDAIDPFLQAWTEDWARKDLEAYLAHYSNDFQPPKGLNLSTWRDQRRNSLLKPVFIEVNINDIQRQPTGASSAQLTFNQTYRSNLYSDRVIKTLYLRWEDERWKILKEESRPTN